MSLAAMPLDGINLLGVIDDQAAVSGSMGASITSNKYDVQFWLSISIQIVWSAGTSPVGVVTIEGSNDGTNFETVGTLSYNLSGNSGAHLMADPDFEFRYVRAVYTRTSGTATMDQMLLVAKNM